MDLSDKLDNLIGDDINIRYLLAQYSPKEEWFLRPKGIHGTDHSLRVFILQEVLAQLLIKEGLKLNNEALRWAAITHDTQRKNDDFDPWHGERAAHWVKENLVSHIPQQSLEMVMYLNTWHNIDDKFIPDITIELAILKDADALDRVRMDDLDPNLLRHEASRTLLVEVAQLVFMVSTQDPKEA
jgi:hypothetical protein